MTLVRLIKIYLKEMYGQVHIGKHLSDNFPIQNCLNQGDALRPLLFNLEFQYAIKKIQENQAALKLNETQEAANVQQRVVEP
jgi:hypothetical protein